MSGVLENGGGRRWSRWRITGWSAVGIILLLPLIAMQFTEEVNWTGGDFVFAGVLLASVGIAYELAVRKSSDTVYRCAAAVALAAAFLLVWVNGAVGIIGSENNAANLMYAGVLAVAISGAFVAQCRPRGMARAMFATALAQVLVGVIALAAGLGASGPGWPLDVVGCTGLFAALWLLSAWLFRSAARGRPEPNTA